MYLHSKSDHPATTKKAIAHGLGVRARRICSQESDYKKERRTIMSNLERRGYKRRDMDQSLTKVDNIERATLLKYKTKTPTNERVPLCVTYNRSLPDIQKIVHEKLPILHRSNKMKTIFPRAPITAFRRDTNLEDMLVHRKHNRLIGKDKPDKCSKKCAVCPFITQEAELKTDTNIFRFNNHINCKSSNLIYGISCKVCDRVVYVGETGTTMYERWQNHMSTVRRKTDNPISRHFNSANHNMESMDVICLELIRRNDIHLRKIRETFWINKLGSIHPKGLNMNYGVGDGIRGKFG